MPSPEILLVSAKEEFTQKALAILGAEGFESVKTVASSGETLRKIAGNQFSLAIVNSGLKDRDSFELVEIINEQAVKVIFLTPRNTFDIIQQSFENTNILLLPKPVPRQTFVMALTLMRHIIGYQRKRQKKIPQEESRLVPAAKIFLMESFEMTEPKAYRFLQKCSMDLRITLQEMAAIICKIYEPYAKLSLKHCHKYFEG